MKPEEQRIAIAKSVGWKEAPQGGMLRPDGSWTHCFSSLPDFINDLNAMHEAVHQLRVNGNQFQWLDYTKNLFKVVWDREAAGDDYVTSGLSWDVIEATAAQRAEAYLRAKGLWKD